MMLLVRVLSMCMCWSSVMLVVFLLCVMVLFVLVEMVRLFSVWFWFLRLMFRLVEFCSMLLWMMVWFMVCSSGVLKLLCVVVYSVVLGVLVMYLIGLMMEKLFKFSVMLGMVMLMVVVLVGMMRLLVSL